MNAIKTKIGFDTKPIPSLDFHELFNISIKIYGRILLCLSIMLLAAGKWVYLKPIQQGKFYQLQLLEQETVQLEHEHSQLTREYDDLTGWGHLQSVAVKLDMHQPAPKETIDLPIDRSK